jgi:Family of unknown function (DUF5519)
MKLAEKGCILAPPVLSGWAQTVSLKIQAWPQIVSATHWQFGDPTKVDGTDFYVDQEELGHIHLDGEIHLLLTETLYAAVIGAKLAERFRWAANWVQFPIEDEPSAEHALWLFQVAYDRLRGTSEGALLDRIKTGKLVAGHAITAAL